MSPIKLFLGSVVTLSWLFHGSALADAVFDRSTTVAVPAKKKLIKSGWDSPSPAYVRDNIREMEAGSPFDGIVVTLANHTDRVFDVKNWNEAEAREQLEIIKEVKWGKFTDNFIMIHTDSNMDWSNDAEWQVVLSRVRFMSELVKASGSKGVLLDPETYGAVFEGFTAPWAYSTQKLAKNMTYAQYSELLTRRGKEFVEALQSATPDIVMLSYYGYNVAGDNDARDPAARTARFEKYTYNGLTPFIDGLVAGAKPGFRFVNINEPAYYYTKPEEYLESYLDMKRMDRWAIPPQRRDKAMKIMEAGQTVDADGVLSLIPEYLSDPGTYMTPAERLRRWEHNFYYAMIASDEYVVLYAMYQSWWNKRNVLAGVNEGIQKAIDRYTDLQSVAIAKVDISDALAKTAERRKMVTDKAPDARKANVAVLKSAPAPWDGQENPAGFTALGPFSQATIFADEPIKATTQAWVAYDATNLYVRVRCEEPFPDQIQATKGDKDHAVWQGDHVSVLLENPDKKDAFFWLTVNPNNAQWDGLSERKRDMGAGFNADWQSTVKMEDGAWWAEFVIPWKSLSMTAPKPGSELRANVTRHRLPELQEDTYWSPYINTGIKPFNELGYWKF